ncbi:MAG: alpha-mannosidase [Candidatus Kryptoniota bacterium]
MSRSSIYHFVPHAHWDREWYLTFEGYRAWLIEMVDDLIELMDNDPSFKSFMFDGQMAMVDDYIEVRPERLELFKKFVEEGRFIIGPFYIQSDEFIPGGESHVRNLLYGLELARKYGSPMMVGYLPDQFGHISQMPQILNGFEIDSAVIYRGFGGEPGQDVSEYIWRSPDGSKVLMVHLPKNGYSFGYFGSDRSETEIIKRFLLIKAEVDNRAQASSRLILNGGDHHWPDRYLTRAVKIISEKLNENAVVSSLPDYIKKLKSEVREEDLPVVDGELRFGLRHAYAVLGGTASSRMYIKQENFRCQNMLQYMVEPLNAIAVILGKKSRAHLIKQAWLYVLQSQNHDVICGTSVDSVYRDAMVRYLRASTIAEQASNVILNDIVPEEDANSFDDSSLYLFNLLPRQRDEVVECEVEFFVRKVPIGINPDFRGGGEEELCKSLRIVNCDGEELPVQILGREQDYGIHYSKYSYPQQFWADRWKILLAAPSLPPSGYRKYQIKKCNSDLKGEPRVITGQNFIENQYLRVEAGENGSLSIYDKQTGQTYCPLNYFEDVGDRGDEYTFCPVDGDRPIMSHSSNPKIRIVESGPLRAALEVTFLLKVPGEFDEEREERSLKTVDIPITTTAYLTCFSKRVDIKTTVDNTAKDHRLRVLFNSGIETDISYADSQFCITERRHINNMDSNFPYELPQNLNVLQRFITVQKGERGFTVMTKGLPEYELSLENPGEVAITLIRSVGELSKSGLKTRPGGDAGWKNKTPDAQCMGIHTFEYSLYTHRFTVDFSSVNFVAESYNSPVLPVPGKGNPDTPWQMSLLQLKSESFAFSSFKESEDGKAVIFRCYNPGSSEDEAEIRTGFPFNEAHLASLNENRQVRLHSVDNTIRLKARGHAIESLRLELK